MSLTSEHESQGGAQAGPTAELARNLPLGDLLSLGTQLRADTTPEALLQEVAEAIRAVLGFPRVYVRLRNPETDALEACAFAGLPEPETSRLRATPTAPGAYQPLLHLRYRLSESYLVPARLIEGRMSRAERKLLLVPLRGRGDRLIGVIYLEPPGDPEALAPSNLQILEAIARQAALGLENARLADRMARLLVKEQLLSELGRDIGNTLDLGEMLTRVVERLRVEFQAITVMLLNERDGMLEVAATIGDVDDAARAVRLRVGEGISGWVVQHGMPFLSNDTYAETRVRPAAQHVGTNRLVRSYIAVPLRSGGRTIGTLNVESHQTNAFTYEDVDLLEAVAAQIGGPIASARLFAEAQRLAEQVKRRNEQLTVLNQLASIAVSTLDLQGMLAATTRQIQRGFGYDHVELYTVEEDGQTLTLTAQAGPVLTNPLGYRQPTGVGLLGRTCRTAMTVRVDDVLLDPDYVDQNQSGTRSELCVPIIAGGRVRAVLNVESRRAGAFTDEDMHTLETAADVLAGAIENARLYQRAQAAAVLEERSRLARDLHDSVSQQLFSMTLTAQAARAQLDKNPVRAAAQLERLQETAAAALAEMRNLIFQLRPPALTEQGLVAAIQQHVAAVDRRDGVTVNLRIVGEERYARGAEPAIFRIVQEALNNVVRHAGACTVEVELEMRPEALRLRVADDGRGFLSSEAAQSDGRHLGLTSMRERAAELGGSLQLRSQPGVGTEILVVVPGRASAAVRGESAECGVQ
jgi:signal transduction histidine kinase